MFCFSAGDGPMYEKSALTPFSNDGFSCIIETERVGLSLTMCFENKEVTILC